MKNFKIKKENKIKLYEGIRKDGDYISPSYINIKNPKYLEMDNMYYSGLIISNYLREHDELILKKLIDYNINIRISMFYEKQDTYKTIKDLTYHIRECGCRIKRGK